MYRGLHLKVALFFLALLPQFVDQNAPHPTLQIILLGATMYLSGLPPILRLLRRSDYPLLAPQRVNH